MELAIFGIIIIIIGVGWIFKIQKRPNITKNDASQIEHNKQVVKAISEIRDILHEHELKHKETDIKFEIVGELTRMVKESKSNKAG